MHAPFIVNSLTLHFKEESFGQARVKTRFLFLRTSDKPEKQKNVKQKKKKKSAARIESRDQFKKIERERSKYWAPHPGP